MTIEGTEFMLAVLVGIIVCLPILSMWARRRPTLGVHLRYGWGSVYVFQDLEHPSLVKVGTTSRRCAIRKAEVSATMTGGCPLRQVFAIDMPFAVAAETIAHRRLQRFKHRSDRGTEWYKLRYPSDLGRIIAEVEKAAFDVRRMAKRSRKWSIEADQRSTSWKLVANGPVQKRIFDE